MRGRYSHGWLILTFFGAALCFLAATIYSAHRVSELDRVAAEISSDVAPSIQHLASARAEVHQLLLALSDYVDRSVQGRTADPAPVLASQRRLEEAARRYFAFHLSPAEKELWPEVEANLHAVDAAVKRTLHQVEQGRSQEARQTLNLEVRPAVEAARVSLIQSIKLNASSAHELALKVQSIRRKATTTAFALDGLSLVVGGIAVALALLQVQKAATLAESLHQMTERRVEELEAFAGRVAHDILGPLSSVEIFLGMAEGQLADSKLHRAMERAHRGLRRTTQIVQDLLTFAKAAARPSLGVSTEVGEALRDLATALDPHVTEAGAELRIDGPSENCRVICSPGVLNSLLENLVRNALKYLGDSPIRQVSVTTVVKGDRVRIEVRDTGPGLPPGTEQAVFEPFVRVGTEIAKPGIGLGLATVKRLTEAHGGAVGVHSTAGKGCIFWFELPMAFATSPAEVPTAPASAPNKQPILRA